jgi:hypothetical protein
MVTDVDVGITLAMSDTAADLWNNDFARQHESG